MGESSLRRRRLSGIIIPRCLTYGKGLSGGGVRNGLQSFANLLI